MLSALVSGAILGLSCGLAPGPLLALVLSQTLRHGAREGCRVALVPLVTDAPIILVALALAAWAAELRGALGVLSLAGGAFVMYLAVDAWRAAPIDASGADASPRSWTKGILTNLLSPHPWLFWLTTGAATLAGAVGDGWWAPVGFLASFYVLLVGSKVVIAILAGRSRGLLRGRGYRIVLRALGLLLAAFAALLVRKGLTELSWI